MKTLKKLFGETKMSWVKVIIFAVIAGIYTGVINLIPILHDTSFQDIAISFEWWVLFAIIICSNCEKPLESGIKVFVFFLISQPIVYLVEMPFLGASVWSYYKYWLIITLLTFPGGIVANLVRKKNIIGTLVLSVALALLGATAANYMFDTYCAFPHHLLTCIFCVLQIIVLIFCLIDVKKFRIFAACVALIAFLITGWLNLTMKSTISASLPEGENWECSLENEDNSTVTCDGYSIILSYNPIFVKDNVIICTNSQGETVKFNIVVGDNKSVNVIPEV